MSAPRTVLGPKIDSFARAALTILAVNAAAVPAKADPAPTLKAMHPDAEPLAFDFDVPAYDVATSNTLTKIRVVVVPLGHGEPDSVEGWLGCDYPHGETDTSAIRDGGVVTVDIADVPDGQFVGQVLFTYDA